MLNLLENIEHVNIIDRWHKVCKQNGVVITLDHAEYFIKQFMFPEYKNDSQLKDKVKIIFSID